jgi:hypothetical protein
MKTCSPRAGTRPGKPACGPSRHRRVVYSGGERCAPPSLCTGGPVAWHVMRHVSTEKSRSVSPNNGVQTYSTHPIGAFPLDLLLLCRDMRESISGAHLHHQEEVHALDLPVTCSIGPASISWLQLPGLGVLKGARLRVWWSGIHHVAVEPLDVARSKDLTNTSNWVYFGVFPVDLGALHVVVRAVVVLCRKSGGAVLRTPSQPRCRAARDLARPLRPVVAWGQASGPSGPITPIQCIGL